MKFVYSTPAQNIAELRRRYRNASGLEVVKIGRWLLSNLTVAQIKNAFDLSDAQVTALREKWIALRDKWADIEKATGE